MIEVGLALVLGGLAARFGLWPVVRRQAAEQRAREEAMAERIAQEIVDRIHRAAG